MNGMNVKTQLTPGFPSLSKLEYSIETGRSFPGLETLDLPRKMKRNTEDSEGPGPHKKLQTRGRLTELELGS